MRKLRRLIIRTIERKDRPNCTRGALTPKSILLAGAASGPEACASFRLLDMLIALGVEVMSRDAAEAPSSDATDCFSAPIRHGQVIQIAVASEPIFIAAVEDRGNLVGAGSEPDACPGEATTSVLRGPRDGAEALPGGKC